MDTAPTATLTLDQLPSLYEQPQERADKPVTRRGLTSYTLGRRDVLKGAATIGAGLGLAALGIFPKAKKASAACVGWLENTIGGPCPVDVGNCSPACGPSTVYSDVCGSDGFHMWTGSYRNRPDNCNGGENDGWLWFGVGCCGPYASCGWNYRCHDGCKNVSGVWKNSICRRVVSNCMC